MNERWHAGNRVELLVNGEAFYPRVFEAIARARREVLLETFIIYEDKVGLALRKALLAAARRGVRVELIVDGYGTADLGTDYIGSLLEAGVRLHLFDPRPRLLGLRTNLFRRLHRKLLVVDGSTAFVGGINFSADHLADFGTMAKQDYAVLVQGPVAQDIRQASLALLEEYGSTPERLPPGLPSLAGETRACLVLRDNGPRSTAIERHYLAAIQRARRRLTIANAYF
ncbi:cardiolipin synthase ClsB, partial [Pseudomonas delhiensis]|uniref:cardiolipin synthase ClsB n=2 Tax=Pseudomonas TaxID=286 RepID=UPI00315A6C39